MASKDILASATDTDTCSAGLQAPDDDVDDDRWIDEQIKKGTSGSADPTAVAAVRSAAAAAAASAAAAPSGAYARQLDGLGAAPSSAGLWQQQPEQLLRAGQDVILTLQQGVAQLQVLCLCSKPFYSIAPWQAPYTYMMRPVHYALMQYICRTDAVLSWYIQLRPAWLCS